MKKNIIRYLSPLILVAMILSMESCSVMRNNVKRDKKAELAEEIKREKKIGKEAEKHLKGDVKKLVEEAFTWLGTPYSYGGDKKGEGADCSGFIMVVFDKVIGCKLPRVSTKQAEFTRKLKPKDVKPGDLVFFATGKDPSKVSHVGMMIDDEQFIHASSSKGVCVSSMESKYYTDHFIMYGRVPCLE